MPKRYKPIYPRWSWRWIRVRVRFWWLRLWEKPCRAPEPEPVEWWETRLSAEDDPTQTDEEAFAVDEEDRHA